MTSGFLRRVTALLVLTTMTTGIAACGGSPQPTPSSTRQSTRASTQTGQTQGRSGSETSGPTTNVTDHSGQGARTVTVSCGDAVYGQLAHDWRDPRQGTLVASPIAWPYVRDTYAGHRGAQSIRRAHAHGSGFAAKALAVVAAGRSIQVVVPVAERARLSLTYAGFHPGPYRVADGASAVTFRPCARGQYPGDQTQFAGGFIVARAQCAVIDVYVPGQRTPLRRQIPFGVPARSCAAITKRPSA
ncbi:MAG: hypothetical protein ACRDK8_13760 [Solirubrobacteraceae bacterium]